MRPPQDPETVRKAKEQDWYLDFDDINPPARDLLEKYSGIAPADVVPHVKAIVSPPCHHRSKSLSSLKNS